MEEWRIAPGYLNYEVSSFGRVRNRRNKYVLSGFLDRYGYLRLSLGNADNVYIHRLVCEAFHGVPKEERLQVNHIDCDRQNNHADNLEWCTPSENVKWGVTHGNLDPQIGLKHAVVANMKPVRIVELNKTFASVKECAEFMGVKPTNISRCLIGSRKGQRIHGHHVEFV